MTIELALCLILAFAAYPVSRSISAHYFIFAAVNGAMLGFTAADTSMLALVFMLLAASDIILALLGGRKILLLSAATSSLLCFESMMNMDWLLSHSTYINAILNSTIVVCLVKGKFNWTHGK